MPLSRDLGTTLSTEAKLHGGFLHLAREDLSQRLAVASPSLYDCLLAAIYFRKVGDQRQALQALDLHADSPVFAATCQRLQSLCHTLNFADAHSTAQRALERWGSTWSRPQRSSIAHVGRTTGSLAAFGAYPTELQEPLLGLNSYLNLDSGEHTSCSGIVDRSRRQARLVDGLFDPASQCWVERESGQVVGELLQPRFDFRRFCGDAAPWRLMPDAHRQPSAEELQGIAVFVAASRGFGQVFTQVASYANAIGYAQHLTPTSEPTITVLTHGPLPEWAQGLLQASTANPLRFVEMDPQRRLRARALVVVPPTWIEGHYVHCHHQRLFRQAAWGWQQPGLASASSGKLYFSRSRLPGGLCLSHSEETLEEALRQRGFAVVHPQDLPLAELAALVNGASVIAGAMGSAMHTVLFRLPDTAPLITLNFAHALPGINNALVERCSGILHNLYLRSCEAISGEAISGETISSEADQPGLLEFNLPRCLDGVELMLAQLESLS